MASFLATYVNASGGERTYSVEAPDLSSAKKILRRRGIKATSLKQAKTAGKNNPNSSASNPETGLQKLLKADLGAAFEKPPGVTKTKKGKTKKRKRTIAPKIKELMKKFERNESAK